MKMDFHLHCAIVHLIFYVFILLPISYSQQQSIGDNQAEKTLENALGIIRSRESTLPSGTAADQPRKRPTPPSSPPRAFVDEFEKWTKNGPTPKNAENPPNLLDFNRQEFNQLDEVGATTTFEPLISELINSARFDLPQQLHPNSSVATANNISMVLPIAQEILLEFVPHFERDFYELMVPQGYNEATKLIAVVSFFDAPFTVSPQFEVVEDKNNWFTIGHIILSQELNYTLCEVQILLKAGSIVQWEQTENGDYNFGLQASHGHIKFTSKLRAKVLKGVHEITSMWTEEVELTKPTVTTLVTEPTTVSSDAQPFTVSFDDFTDDKSDSSSSYNETTASSSVDEPAQIILDLDPNLYTINNGSSTEPTKTIESKDLEDEALFMLDPIEIELNNSLNSILSASREIKLDKKEGSDDENEEKEVIKTTVRTNFVQNEMGEDEAENVGMEEKKAEEESKKKEEGQKDKGKEEEEVENVGREQEKEEEGKAEEKDEEVGKEEKNGQEKKEETNRKEEKEENIGKEKEEKAEVKKEENANEKKETGGDEEEKKHHLLDVNDYIKAIQIELDAQLMGQDNGTIRQIAVPFASLPSLAQSPVPNLAITIPESKSQTIGHDGMDYLVRLELHPSNGTVLDILPHHIGPGDTAQLWLNDQEKVANEPLDFTLFASVVDWNGHQISQPMSIFKGQFVVDDPPKGPPPQIHHPEALMGYEFVIDENATDGTEIGRIKLENVDNNNADEHAEFELFGNGSHLFKIDSDGTMRLHCGAENGWKTGNGTHKCLDHSMVQAYHLIVTAKRKNGGYRSLPEAVTVRVRDVNDNPPELKLFSDEIVVVNGQLRGGAPFMIGISDKDSAPENRFNALSLAGNLSIFFKLEQFDESNGGLFGVILKEDGVKLTEEGTHELLLVVADGSGQSDTKIVPVRVTNNLKPYHFTNQIYNKSMPAHRIHTGVPIVQLQLKHPPPSTVTVNYLISDGNPGWLSVEPFIGNVFGANVPKEGVPPGNYSIQVVAVDQEKRQVLAECQLLLELTGEPVIDEQLQFPAPYVSISIARLDNDDENDKIVDLVPFPEGEYLRHAEFNYVDLRAWDEAERPAQLPKGALTVFLPGNGTIRLDMAKLRNVRSLHLNFTIKPNSNFIATNGSEKINNVTLVVITLQSDETKTLALQRQREKPCFAAPWTNESVPIRLRIAEELPVGHPIIQLPAYNPMNSTDRLKIFMDGPYAKFFTINDDGIIAVKTRLDFEQLLLDDQLIELHLIATSMTSPQQSTTALVQLELLDVDDMTPVIQLVNGMLKEPNRVLEDDQNALIIVDIEENSGHGKLELMLLNVSDVDSKKHQCELIGGEGKFAIEKKNAENQWSVNAKLSELDRELQDHYALVFRCKDEGGNNGEIPIQLNVLDKNDNRPVIMWDRQDTQMRLLDNMPAGSAVGRFFARDKDAGDNGRVEFSLGQRQQPAGTKFFRVDPVTGVLYVADRPLVELSEMLGGESMELEVIAKDKGHPPLQSSIVLQMFLENGIIEGPRVLQMVKPALGDMPIQLEESDISKKDERLQQ
ncbi:hypothetical protein niasHS_009128 [Heterodera schachtii]|uniref:Cadherin domain-containing protein n=1 Tax=Heterodera schachtii TaxID=97005 RepID=A0ABD2JDY5_HETSC